ncbi:MAG: hypothetical protein RL338_1308 [Chloroflexota bacterium]
MIPRRLGSLPLVPAGALAGALVVAVVALSAFLAGGPVVPPTRTPLPTGAAVPTPVPVAAAPVAWFAPAPDGTYALSIATIGSACTTASAGCGIAAAETLLRLAEAPRAVVRSPSGTELAVVDAGTAATGGSVYLVTLPAGTVLAPGAPGASVIDVAAAPSPSVEPVPSGGPTTTGKPTPWPFASPTASPAPGATGSPDGSTATPPTSAPSASAAASPSPAPSASAGASPVPTPAPSASATASPAPSVGRDWSVVAIASGLIVGETMGFSPDGAWFAFTARPADGSRGHDVWLRRAGEPIARRVTDDGRSVFASWSGSLLVGSRVAFPSPSPVPTPTPASSATTGTDAPAAPAPSARPSSGIPAVDGTPSIADPVAFLVEPASGRRTDLAAPVWRPVVDPLGRWAIHWTGRLRFDRTSVSWVPAEGGFVIAPWAALISPAATPVAPPPSPSSAPPASLEPSASPATPGPSASMAPSAAPASPPPSAAPGIPPGPIPGLGDLGAVDPVPGDWEIRWESTGLRVAIWVRDPLDRRLGRLSLLVLDPWTGRIDPDARLLVDEPALAGVSLEPGRLAWATPPGQDGLGSRLQVLAWGPDGAGRIDGVPIAERGSVVVVR